MKVRFTSRAVGDLNEARTYYDHIDPDLGTGLLVDLETLLERLQLFPQGAPPVDGFPGVRRARMRRYPYGVLYRLLDGEELVVLRVLHTRSNTRDQLGKQ